MEAIVLHAARDLRIERLPAAALQPGEVRVEVQTGGICGSDLHLFMDGGVGDIRLRHPLILGHEIAGVVAEVGRDVTHVEKGDPVVVNPALACGRCGPCLRGRQHHCEHMRFMGSAKKNIQGGFRQDLVVHGSQAFAHARALDHRRSVFTEPLAVCLHAARQAGDLFGRTVLVTGCGPIGLLSIMVAKAAGAGRIFATDIDDFPLATARRIGATATMNVAAGDGLPDLVGGEDTVDVVFEASGNGAALRSAMRVLSAGGTVVQIGMGQDVGLSLNDLIFKEANLRGTFRFNEEFGAALRLLEGGAFDVDPLVSDRLPYADAGRAFDLAAARSRSIKVQLAFAD